MKLLKVNVKFWQQIALALVLVAASALVIGGIGYAQDPNIQDNLCGGADTLQYGEPGDCESAGAEAQDTVNSTVALVINVFSWIVGVVSVLFIIYGGFRYITSGGDTTKVTNAKNTILYAIIGLIIVALAQVIVRFVLGQAAGTGS